MYRVNKFSPPEATLNFQSPLHFVRLTVLVKSAGLEFQPDNLDMNNKQVAANNLQNITKM